MRHKFGPHRKARNGTRPTRTYEDMARDFIKGSRHRREKELLMAHFAANERSHEDFMHSSYLTCCELEDTKNGDMILNDIFELLDKASLGDNSPLGRQPKEGGAKEPACFRVDGRYRISDFAVVAIKLLDVKKEVRQERFRVTLPSGAIMKLEGRLSLKDQDIILDFVANCLKGA